MRQLIICLLFTGILKAHSQGYVDQEKTAPLSNEQSGPVDNVQKVVWQVYDYKAFKKGDKTGPWTALKTWLDSMEGTKKELRLEIVELANRVTSDKLKPGRRLVVPSSFPADYRAYSPYPFEYSQATSIPKLFLLDKYTQTFGAYEYGKLVHWGIASSGNTDDKTPNGQYNFTWKAEYRESSAAPPGEVWEMYWMYNFEPRIGLHVHQYALPIGAAVSHGCVRISMADALWNYTWAEGTKGKNKGTPIWIINHNPAGRPAHWGINAEGKVYSLVRLPEGDDVNSIVQGR